MDPLTHTLVGTSLAATRLGETTRRAAAALVIGANLPDIDVLSYFAGGDVALGFRRGWTHGVLALAVLPALLALLLITWDRWRPSRSERPLSPAWLFGLCYLAVLTHPTLDWLNTYGMRWLMPFDGTWYYGDAVFILDPWIWLMLGTGWLIGRRPKLGLLITWAVVTGLLLLMVLRRAPGYAPAVITILLILLLALVWKPVGARSARRAAAAGLVLTTLFISAMLATHEVTEAAVREDLDRAGIREVEQIMVGPMPLNPFVWEFVARNDERLRHGQLSWLGGRALQFSTFDRVDARTSALWTDIEMSDQIPGFLSWVRFPWLEPETPERPSSVRILDARYTRSLTSGFGGAVVHFDENGTSP